MSNLETVNTEIDSHKVFWEQERKQKKDRKRILSLIPNISDAIQAMVDGIEDAIINIQNRNTRIVLNMETYGEVTKDGICYGCAATVAIEKVFKQLYDKNNIGSVNDRANYMGIHVSVLNHLEIMFNSLRQADFSQLVYLYDDYKIQNAIYFIEEYVLEIDDTELMFSEYDSDSGIERKLLLWKRIIKRLKKEKL